MKTDAAPPSGPQAGAAAQAFMHEAIRLSRQEMRQGRGGPFGAVVVHAGQIVGRGWNQVTSANDPTAHAEVVAIRDACRRLGRFWLEDCELFSSCEPCPMCLAAAYWARLRQITFAATRADAAWAGFMDERIYEELARAPGERKLPAAQLLRDEARAVLAEWRAKIDKTNY